MGKPSRRALQQLRLQELGDLEKKVKEAEIELAEEAKSRERLSRDNASKIHQIALMEIEMNHLDEAYQNQLVALQKENMDLWGRSWDALLSWMGRREKDLANRIELLKKERKRLDVETVGFDDAGS